MAFTTTRAEDLLLI